MYRKNSVCIQYNCILHVFSDVFNTMGKWEGTVTQIFHWLTVAFLLFYLGPVTFPLSHYIKYNIEYASK